MEPQGSCSRLIPASSLITFICSGLRSTSCSSECSRSLRAARRLLTRQELPPKKGKRCMRTRGRPTTRGSTPGLGPSSLPITSGVLERQVVDLDRYPQCGARDPIAVRQQVEFQASIQVSLEPGSGHQELPGKVIGFAFKVDTCKGGQVARVGYQPRVKTLARAVLQ